MNDVFLSLPLEKQQCIIQAALQVFAKHEYKHANTDDIASIAGISKGSLFYYFKNKMNLYTYIIDYVSTLVEEAIKDETFHQMTDFFEIMDYSAQKKLQLMKENPYILDFVMCCIREKSVDITSTSIQKALSSRLEEYAASYFKHVDYTKFKDSIQPKEVYAIMLYATEGYLINKQRFQNEIDVEGLMQEYKKWKKMFVHFCYKEEFIDEQYRSQ